LLAVISIGAGKKDNQRLKISPSLMPSLMPTKTYHLYITDTTPKQLSAEDVALLYRALNQMRLLAPEKSERFTSLRWAETFYAAVPWVMTRVLEYEIIDADPLMLLMFFMDESVDPNVNRKRLLSPWVKAAKSQLINTTNLHI
jgi:hypothetical protein